MSSGRRAASSISTTHLAIVAEEGLVVDFLEGLALAHAALDLADEQDHRRRILGGDMDAVLALVAPGPRVTKQMPGLPVSLP